MSVSVTDNAGYISINDGNSVRDIEKAKVAIVAYGDNVQIFWDDVHYCQYVYSDFTAPTGASASAVAASIAAFLDTGGGADSNVKTVSYTVGMPGVSGTDYNFTSVANANEQSIQLGATTIIPANSPIEKIVIKCTAAPTTAGALADVGNTDGGDEWMSAIIMDTLNAINSVSTQVVANASASSIYFSVTPGGNWNLQLVGSYKIWITYTDNSSN